MTLSANVNTRVRLGRSGAKPILLAKITVPPRGWIYLDGNTNITSVTVVVQGTRVDGTSVNNISTGLLAAGSEFSIGASTAETAANIATAINNAAYHLRASSSGSIVEITATQSYYSNVTQTNTPAELLDNRTTISAIQEIATNGSDLRVLAEAPTTYSFCTGDKVLFGYPNAIMQVGSISRDLDPISRKVSTGSMDLTFVDDGIVRELVAHHVLRGAKVDLYVGTQDTVEADFVQIPSLEVEKITPDFASGTINVSLRDYLGAFTEVSWTGQIISRHPLDAIRFLLSQTGAQNGVHYSDSSLDPVSAVPNQAHHAIGRFRYKSGEYTIDNKITQDTPVFDMVNDLLLLSGGTLRPDNAGQLVYIPWSDSAPAIRTLEGNSSDGWDLSEMELIEVDDNATAAARVETYQPEGVGTRPSMQLNDIDALYTYGKALTTTIDTQWVTAWARYHTSVQEQLHNRGVSEDVAYDALEGCYGFSGNTSWVPLYPDSWGSTGPAVIQNPGYGLNSDRVAYLRFSFRGEKFYTVCDSTSINTAFPTGTFDVDGVGAVSKLKYNRFETYTDFGFSNGYGGFDHNPGSFVVYGGSSTKLYFFYGTTGFQDIGVEDVTLPVFVAQQRLKRLKLGMPRVRFRTNLSHIDLEIGDLVSINHEGLCYNLRDGITSDTIWEVTSTTLDVTGDSPGISIELAWARDSVVDDLALSFPADPVVDTSGGIETEQDVYASTQQVFAGTQEVIV